MGNYGELGRIGQNRYGGVFYEEFLKDLRGRKGISVYKEMGDNDDIIGAILFSMEMLIRQVDWTVEPSSHSKIDKAAANFVEECIHDMQDTWTDTISEILSFLQYGWSYHEIVYKRRMGKTNNPKSNSKYSDGLIGWRKLPIRSQDTLYQWDYDSEDNLLGMTQLPPPDYGLLTIPIEKALHFRTKSQKNNPEGRSVLRNAYRSWYFKRRIQEIEGIGIERDLAGLPVIIAPENLDLWENDPDAIRTRNNLERMIQKVKRDESEGVVLPFGFDFKLLSTGGSRQFDTNAIINRYDSRMAMTVLADFILLGHQQVGSFALSSDKTELFSLAIGTFLDIICETFNNQGIPRLIEINASHFKELTEYPKLIHGDIETADLDGLGKFIKDMSGVGVLVPDEELENYVRQQANLPVRQENSRNFTRENKPAMDRHNPEDLEEDDLEDMEATKAAKRLGR